MVISTDGSEVFLRVFLGYVYVFVLCIWLNIYLYLIVVMVKCIVEFLNVVYDKRF